jgi:hypothetical protein
LSAQSIQSNVFGLTIIVANGKTESIQTDQWHFHK